MTGDGQVPVSRFLRASFRDTWLLTRQFAWPLAWFITIILAAGGLYYWLSIFAHEPLHSFPEALYHILTLTFFQAGGEFPKAWYLEVFYFIMPVIGIIILAQGITEFGIMLFNRRQRSKDWEIAVASTFSNHHILIGLGHLGFRVANYLHQLGEEIVVVELNPSTDLVVAVKKLAIPVIQDDAARSTALEAAGADKARSIILATQNDSLNLQVALKARRINPGIRVILRIFDDEFANSLQDQFGFVAFSATDMAAPAFAAAAAGVEMTRPIGIAGQTLSLASFSIVPNGQLDQRSVADIERKHEISIVLLQRTSHTDLHPTPETRLQGNDIVGIIGQPSEIALLIQSNRL